MDLLKWFKEKKKKKQLWLDHKKNMEKAKSMDMALHGPKLHCENCGKSKVLSFCYFCQYKGTDMENAKYCRVCGTKKDYQEGYNYLVCLICELTKLPAEIGKFTNLPELYLFINQSTQLPSDVANITNLTELNLHKNQLSQSEVEKIKKTLPKHYGSF